MKVKLWLLLSDYTRLCMPERGKFPSRSSHNSPETWMWITLKKYTQCEPMVVYRIWFAKLTRIILLFVILYPLDDSIKIVTWWNDFQNCYLNDFFCSNKYYQRLLIVSLHQYILSVKSWPLTLKLIKSSICLLRDKHSVKLRLLSPWILAGELGYIPKHIYEKDFFKVNGIKKYD